MSGLSEKDRTQALQRALFGESFLIQGILGGGVGWRVKSSNAGAPRSAYDGINCKLRFYQEHQTPDIPLASVALTR